MSKIENIENYHPNGKLKEKSVFNDEKQLLKTQKILNENNIFPRRHFYPSLELLPYIKQNQKCANSQNISERILCLPLYNELSLIDARRITDIIKKCIL